MNYYCAYGLSIRSDIAIPYFPPDETRSASGIRIRREATHGAEEEFHDDIRLRILDSGEIFLFIGKYGKFRVHAGREVEFVPKGINDEKLVVAYLIGFVMSLLLYQRGLFVLHGSVLRVHGRNIAFMGRTGDGKSFLAANLLKRGHQLIADDVVALDVADHYAVRSAFPWVKMRLDTAQWLGFAATEANKLHPEMDKHVIAFDHQFCAEPGRLDHICVLETGEPALHPLPVRESFVQMIRHSAPTRWNAASNPRHFALCRQVVDAVPVSVFRRRKALADVARDIERLEEYLLQAGACAHG